MEKYDNPPEFNKMPEKQNKQKTEEEYKKEAKKKITERINNERKLYEDNAEIEVIPYTTFKVYDMANMFPWNITPAMYESKMAHAVAAKQRMFNSLTPQMGFMIIALLIGGVIAAVIAWRFFTKDTAGACNCVCDVGKGLIQTAQNMSG